MDQYTCTIKLLPLLYGSVYLHHKIIAFVVWRSIPAPQNYCLWCMNQHICTTKLLQSGLHCMGQHTCTTKLLPLLYGSAYLHHKIIASVVWVSIPAPQNYCLCCTGQHNCPTKLLQSDLSCTVLTLHLGSW